MTNRRKTSTKGASKADESQGNEREESTETQGKGAQTSEGGEESGGGGEESGDKAKTTKAKEGMSGESGRGNVSAAPCPTGDPADGLGLPIAYAREGETRRQTWERLRRDARGVGATRKEAIAYATREVARLHPEFPPMPEPEPQPEPEPAPEPEPEPEPVGLTGLGDLPGDWPELPPNAALPAEVQWVQSNRIRCVQGMEVDLSRALAPAPSHAALAWLETAVLFPSKWADVALKGTQNAQDEAAHVRGERKSIEELRAILAQMAPTCPHCGEPLA